MSDLLLGALRLAYKQLFIIIIIIIIIILCLLYIQNNGLVKIFSV